MEANRREWGSPPVLACARYRVRYGLGCRPILLCSQFWSALVRLVLCHVSTRACSLLYCLHPTATTRSPRGYPMTISRHLPRPSPLATLPTHLMQRAAAGAFAETLPDLAHDCGHCHQVSRLFQLRWGDQIPHPCVNRTICTYAEAHCTRLLDIHSHSVPPK